MLQSIFVSILISVCSVVVCAQTDSLTWTGITNGEMWKDTDGNEVQAHGAGFLLVGDTWYMIGEDRSQ